MRAQFAFPGLPRNPVLRALMLVVGAAVVVGLLTVGLVVGACALAVAAVALAIRQWRLRRHRAAPDPSIIDGEFTVVAAPRAKLPRPE